MLDSEAIRDATGSFDSAPRRLRPPRRSAQDDPRFLWDDRLLTQWQWGNALGNGKKKDKALKGRDKVVPSIGKVVPPLQGFVRIPSGTQGCARASLALGWLVTGLWPEGLTFGAPH